MDLLKLLNLKKNSIVSIVGAGGKTTFMFEVAEELRKRHKVLVTTTTKIYSPLKGQYDFLETGKQGLTNLILNQSRGIFVYGSSVNEEGKLTAIDCVELEQIAPFFHYIIIEADGSKRKSIKGWNSSEPVICKTTTATVGVLSIDNIGKEINENNIHRLKEFLHIIQSKENEKITIDNLVSVVFHHNGLFKNALGEKILFINKVEDEQSHQDAYELIRLIKKENKKNLYIDKIILGSLIKGKYDEPILLKRDDLI